MSDTNQTLDNGKILGSNQIAGSTLRAALRLLLLLILVGITVPFCAVVLTVAGIGGKRRRYRLVQMLTPIVCGAFARGVGLRIEVRGRRDPGVRLFVGNHVTYLDILVAAVGVGGVFVSRHDVKKWPVIGIFAKLAGTVFLDRRSLRSAISSSEGLVERAREGIRIIFFPEGGTTSGEGVGEFRPFLFGATVAAGLSVQPFTIRYRSIGKVPVVRDNHQLLYWYDPAPDLSTHGWRLLGFRNIHVTLEYHEPIAPPVADGDKNAVRAYAEALRSSVKSGL